jgi:protein phosphatase
MLRIAEQFSDTDVGRQRHGNEDNLFARAPVFVVADGMGGAQAGEVASEITVRTFDRGLPGGPPADALVHLIEQANHAIHERARADRETAGMGTTVTAAYVGEDEVVIAHVGDSRAYLLRDGELTQLTRDHSLVRELIEAGKLTEEEAESHPQRSVITRVLGNEPRVEVDVDVFPARAGDVVLLCSDGLTSMVPEARVRALLREASSLEQAGRGLIAAANAAGGRDNITVVLFRLESVTASGSRRAAEARQTTEHVAVEAPTREQSVVRASTAVAERPEAHASASRREPPARAARPAPGRRRRRRWVPAVVVVAFLTLPILLGGWLASRAVYFLGTDDARTVTIYRGLPYELPFGIRLYERYAGSGVRLDQIAPARRATFTDHQLRSRDDAEDLVIALERGRIQP